MRSQRDRTIGNLERHITAPVGIRLSNQQIGCCMRILDLLVKLVTPQGKVNQFFVMGVEVLALPEVFRVL
jgi:hypothetical protein